MVVHLFFCSFHQIGPDIGNQPDVFMLQGFFFQERTFFDIEIDDAVVVARRGLTCDMFAGVISLDEFSLEWTGWLADAVGDSVLDNIEFSETDLSFDKIYLDRNDRIHYTFRKSGELWIGGYNGELVGTGKGNCILTPVSQQIFQPAE